jgi:tetratricopeptide (TPR) repeat protein
LFSPFQAVLNRGFLFDKLDEQERAYEDYTRAIAIDCKCAFAYFNRGISLDKLNHWEDAVDDFSKAIEID